MTKKKKQAIDPVVAKPRERKYSENGLRKGRITDDEARLIEQLLPMSTYEDVAKQLNRRSDTVRKWAQNNNVSKDKVSSQKFIIGTIKKDPTFQALEKVLTDDELVVAHQSYMDWCDQFGNDIVYSERQEIIDFAVVSCLLHRELVKDTELQKILEDKNKERAALQEKRISEEDPDDLSEEWIDQINELEISIAEFKDELKDTKSRQDTLMSRKERLNKSLHGSRTQRAKDLTHATENFSSLMVYLQKNPDYRKQRGIELEQMRLAVDAEWFRLSQIHSYDDGELAYPVFNSEVVKRELELQEEQKESNVQHN